MFGGSHRLTACWTSGGRPSSGTIGFRRRPTVPFHWKRTGRLIVTVCPWNAKPTAKLKAWKLSCVMAIPRA